MKYRSKLNRKKSRKIFKKGVKRVKRKNYARPLLRGGYRM